MDKFNQICKNIKEIKIQGAENVAKAGLAALKLNSSKSSIKRLLSLRPTEPCLKNAIRYSQKNSIEAAFAYFNGSDDMIAHIGQHIIHKGDVIFTHCHSSTVINILKEAKKHRNFQVINTETRPLLQGRKTSRELAKAGIKVTEIVDSAVDNVLEKSATMKKADLMIIGTDAILKNGDAINKIGSKMFAELAHDHKIPVYIATISWKYSNVPVKIEQRNPDEIWHENYKKISIKNPAFDQIPAKYITGIISELGIHSPAKFVKLAKNALK